MTGATPTVALDMPERTVRPQSMAGPATTHHRIGPAWATSLGIVAVLFGTLFTAAEANELMVQAVIAPGSSAAQGIPADCREDEAEEEEVSIAECELMVANVRIMLASRPPWFRSAQMGLTSAGALLAFLSILVGVALVDARGWAPSVAVITFGGLIALDAVSFVTGLYVGPLLRAVYLWNTLLWFSIHLCMTAGAVVGRQAGLTPIGTPADHT